MINHLTETLTIKIPLTMADRAKADQFAQEQLTPTAQARVRQNTLAVAQRRSNVRLKSRTNGPRRYGANGGGGNGFPFDPPGLAGALSPRWRWRNGSRRRVGRETN